jgi:DNA mismatch repair protein MutL
MLKEIGFDIEEFGNNSFILRAMPSFLINDSPKELLTDLISELSSDEIKKQPDKKRDRINKFIACHGAVKAGDKLSSSEIAGLIKDLYKTTNPTTCPHGRPTMIKIGKENLEKMFERR